MSSAEYERERYAKWAAAGKCTKCGKERDDLPRVTCTNCRRKVRAAIARRKEPLNWTASRFPRRTAKLMSGTRSLSVLKRLNPAAGEFAQWLIDRQWPHISRCYYEGTKAYLSAKRELWCDAVEYAKAIAARGGDYESEKADLDAPITHGLTANRSIAWLAAESADPIPHGTVSR